MAGGVMVDAAHANNANYPGKLTGYMIFVAILAASGGERNSFRSKIAEHSSREKKAQKHALRTGRTLLLVTCAGLLFGYDIGITGGVESMQSFQKEFFPEACASPCTRPEDLPLLTP